MVSPLSPPEGTGQVRRDPERSITEVSIAAREGRVEWSDVLRGLSRAGGLDDSALAGLLPGRSLDLASWKTRGTLLALNLSLSPCVQIEALPGERGLRILVDEEEVRARDRQVRRLVRGALPRLLRGEAGPALPPLALDDGWDDAPAGRDLALFVHGLDSSPERLEGIRDEARTLGLPTGSFRYTTDGPLQDAAVLLAGALAEVARADPRRRITIVAFSAGGLVARAAVEDPRLDPGNVHRLLLVAPPTRGSLLAPFQPVWEVLEHSAGRGSLLERLLASVEDGLGEAGQDLRPGSPFLRDLDRRARNPRIRYTVILGTGGPISGWEIAALERALDRAASEYRVARFVARPVREWLRGLEEVVWGQGDGAVSVRRGLLEGAGETILLPFSHLEMLSREGEAPRQLHRTILERLGRAPAR